MASACLYDTTTALRMLPERECRFPWKAGRKGRGIVARIGEWHLHRREVVGDAVEGGKIGEEMLNAE